MVGIGFLLVPIVVVVLLVIGSTLFRAAVAVANMVIGPEKPDASLLWDWEAAEDDEEFEEVSRKLQAIPEPGLGQGMIIVLLFGIAELIIGYLLEGMFRLDRARRRGDVEEWLPLHLLGLSISFLVMTSLVSSMLPTTGKRAAVATFFFYLICFLVIGVIVGVIIFVLRSTGP